MLWDVVVMGGNKNDINYWVAFAIIIIINITVMIIMVSEITGGCS